jgi:hypothetical protein
MRCGASVIVQPAGPADPARRARHLDVRRADVTTAHVVSGPLLLAVTFWLTWLAHRDLIEAQTGARMSMRPSTTKATFRRLRRAHQAAAERAVGHHRAGRLCGARPPFILR